MASNSFNQDLIFFNSQLQQGFSDNAVVPVEGEAKKRRRRRKKAEESGEMRKRKLSQEQVNKLEYSFNIDHNLETQRKEGLARELALDAQQVAIWFQNRRVRWRAKRLEEDYSNLKATHECVIAEKSQLEEEVKRLREQLSEAREEMRKGQSDLGSSCSQGSALFSWDMDPYFSGEFEFDEHNYYGSAMEWISYDL